jgi:hypothetical protein
MWKQSCSVSYSLSGMGHSPHRRCCVSVMFFALLSRISRSIIFGWCCLSCLWMSFARDSSNGGFMGMVLYMSCSLSNLLFSIVQMVVPSGLCSEMCQNSYAETRLFPTYSVHSRTTKPTSLPADPAGRSHRSMSCRSS